MMLGDWIKLETATPDKPEVVLIASILRIDQDAVTGKLVRLWCWADTNSIDGASVRITAAFVDRLVGKRGFAAAMRKVGWLAGEDGALSFPGFCRHNGRSAKARAAERRKKQEQRERDETGDRCPEPNGTNVPNQTGQKQGQDRDQREREKKKDNLPPKPPEGAGGAESGDEPPKLRTVLPDSLADVPAFVRCWEDDWLPYQVARNRGRPPTIMTLERHLAACAKLGAGKAVGALKSAIEKNWAAPDLEAKVTQFQVERPWEEAPDDWRAYWRETYPPEEFPDAPRYEDGEWSDVRTDHKKQIWEALQKRLRRSA